MKPLVYAVILFLLFCAPAFSSTVTITDMILPEDATSITETLLKERIKKAVTEYINKMELPRNRKDMLLKDVKKIVTNYSVKRLTEPEDAVQITIILNLPDDTREKTYPITFVVSDIVTADEYRAAAQLAEQLFRSRQLPSVISPDGTRWEFLSKRDSKSIADSISSDHQGYLLVSFDVGKILIMPKRTVK